MKILSEAIIEDFTKHKEAFILEELQPYFKDGKVTQKVKLRLAEIEDFKRLVNERFDEFIKDLKEKLDKKYWLRNSKEETLILIEGFIDKLVGDRLC